MTTDDTPRITKYGPRLTQEGHEKRKATLQALFDQGLSCEAVAALVGVSFPLVSRLAKRYGLTRPPKTCRGCRGLFRPTQANQAFCRAACREVRKRELLVPRTCAICGTAFRPRDGRQLYCRPNCNQKAFVRRAYYRKRGRVVPAEVGAPKAPRTCGTCGGQFRAVHPGHRYCSKVCQQRNSQRREYMRRRAHMVKAVRDAVKDCNEIMERSRPAFERAFNEAVGRITRKWRRLVGASTETIEDE